MEQTIGLFHLTSSGYGFLGFVKTHGSDIFKAVSFPHGIRQRHMNQVTIVTGGAGFIGSHLVGQLIESGQSVRVIELPGVNVEHLPAEVEVIFADIRDRDTVAQALRGGRWVYHLAANPNLWIRDRGEFDAVNHIGTVNVLEAAIEAGAEGILHTSTESILTRAGATEFINEYIEISESDTVGPYCLSKLRAENVAMEKARAGYPVVVANPTMPVGPGDRRLSPPTRLILDFCQGRLPAMMECTLNMIDVRDVATGLIRVLERGSPGRRYLLGGENLTLEGFLRILSELTGVPIPRWRVPYPVGLAAAYLNEFWADHVSGQPPEATVTGVRLARRLMHFDHSDSLAGLGLSPRPIRESAADAVNWLRQTGQLCSDRQ
jgi:dihydroflavonol-4-reductase